MTKENLTSEGQSSLHGMNLKQLRFYNMQIMLSLFYQNKVLSKSQLVQLTQLSFPTITNILQQLREKGIIDTEKRHQYSRGKADDLYTIKQKPYDILCLNVSPYRLTGVIVNSRMSVKHAIQSKAISPLSPQDLVRDIIDFYTYQLKRNQATPLKIAFAVHGQVDYFSGTSLTMPQAPWKEPIELKYLIEEKIGTEVLLDNDCAMLALAEKWVNDQRGQDICVVNIDYGIGSSFLINNKVYRGQLFGSGQIGHNIIDPDGIQCGCGRYGCLETIASANAMLRDIRIAMKSEQHHYHHLQIDLLTFDECVSLYHQGDSNVTQVVERAARKIGLTLYNFILTLNINQIILYGNTAQLGEQWREKIIEQMLYNPFEYSANLAKYRTLVRFGQLTMEQRLTGIGFLFVERQIEQLALN